jgi:hypothetical protein
VSLPAVCVILVALTAPAKADTDPALHWQWEYEQMSSMLGDSRTAPRYRAGGDTHFAADPQSLLWTTDRDPLDVVLRRTNALIADLRFDGGIDCTAFLNELAALKRRADALPPDSDARQALYTDACRLRRRIALSNPLMDFDKIICVLGKGWGGTLHYGPWVGSFRQPRDRLWTPEDYETFDFSTPQQEGEPDPTIHNPGLFVFSDIKSVPKRQPLFSGTPLSNGDHKGDVLNAYPGDYHFGFDLSFDGKTVLFARQLGKGPFHIFAGSVDGSSLTQLTDSWFADWEPCFMPDDRITFISLRRWICARCQVSFVPQACGTLFSMKADGSDLYPISWHESSELYPTVDNDGKIVYTRWDYVDRDFNAGQHIWTCYPDGRDPRSPHGNYGQPHSTSSRLSENDTFPDLRQQRPMAEFHIRAIPSRSGRYVAIAGIHHGSTPGVPILIDTTIADDNAMSQLKIVKGYTLPWEEGGVKYPVDADFSTPWPLSDRYFLVSKISRAGRNVVEGVYLLDVFGNSELLADGALFGARPMRPRPGPPILPTQTWQGERHGADDHKRAVISITNLYDADQPWPDGTKIDRIRIIQIVPKPWSSTLEHQKTVGYSFGGIPRMVLGTVPVESDGSACFEAPVGREIYFQVLDENGMAVQSMRSGTFVHPGEHLSCRGCHDRRVTAPPEATAIPLALRRKPSPITPDIDEACPLTFARLVQPVLEKTCVPCHTKNQKGPTTTAYNDYRAWAFYYDADGGARGLLRDTGGYRNISGSFGARESKLGRLLTTSHADRISKDELHRMILWLDTNSMELGAFHDDAEQRAGKVVWPVVGIDPKNPTGVEHSLPLR